MTTPSSKTMYSFFTSLHDLLLPRPCLACGRRLSPGEGVVCSACNLHLPRTFFWLDAYENTMTRMFWGIMPVEKAAALFFYEPQSAVTNIVYSLKYRGKQDAGEQMGRMMALEMKESGFFNGIDLLVPVPLTPGRKRERGFNQSREIAEGLSLETGIKVKEHLVVRTKFTGSQTAQNAWERRENVKNAFETTKRTNLKGKHVMLVDDVMTTGATLMSCGGKLVEAGAKVSVVTFGFTAS